jgi:hypothetical protein
MEEPHLKHTARPPFSPDMAPSDFFLFGWLKIGPSSRSIGDISELFELVHEILRTLTTDTIARVLRTGSKDWNKLLVPMVTMSDPQHSKGKSIFLKKLLIG